MMLNAQAIRESISAVLRDSSKDDVKPGTHNPYEGTKGSVMLEARMFNETPLNPTKCFDCLTKIVNLITTKGEQFTPAEETDLFFGITKLFQSSNDRLRRMIYLGIKVLRINESEAFVVTSSLTKDMNSGSDVHRANAIRVLTKIIDPSMATQIERYLKTAIVDKSPFVASSALLCGMSLLRSSPELVRRWVNEVTESVRSKNTTVQFHALALLYELKKSDRLALHKVVGGLITSPMKSSMAECLLVRYATRILRSEKDAALEASVFEYLMSRLHHRSEMTILEAARAVSELAMDDSKGGVEVYGRDLTPVLTALQILLSSQRAIVRFAAVRTLSKLARSRPQAVARCNTELEALLTDGNRSIATLALTTLLKTGHEAGVERLIKQISALMTEIADSFRIEVVNAVRQLSAIYPAKHKVMMNFLATQLREEGSYGVKKELVDALAAIMAEVPQAQEQGLLHLCEFIEDCEYPVLCVRILGLVGSLARCTTCPSKFIRFIYNRLILESAAVRAAAVDALTRIGLYCPQLRKDIGTLLEGCLVDNDDEIRDRALLYFKALQDSQESDTASTSASSTVSLQELLDPEVPVVLDALLDYTSKWITSSEGLDLPFDLSQLPSQEEYDEMKKAVPTPTAAPVPAPAAQFGAATPVETDSVGPVGVAAELQQTCSLLCPNETFGELDHSQMAVPLTEKEAEYAVLCVKHILTSDHLVFEFQVTNTMPDQTLENVEVVPESYDTAQWQILGCSRIDSLPLETPRSCYMILKASENLGGIAPSGVARSSFGLALKYLVREEGDDFGYDDSYALESISVSIADYIMPRALRPGQFKPQWSSLAECGEASAKLSLAHKSLQSAVTAIIDLLNLAPCEQSETVDPNASTHDLLLAGVITGGALILLRAMLVMSPKHGCLLKLASRSKDKAFAERVLALFE